MEARGKLRNLTASSLGKEPTPSCPLNTRLEVYKIFFFLWRYGPTRAMVSSFLRFLDHTHTYHTRKDSSRPVISSSQRPLPDNTQHSQETDIHVQDGIQTHYLSRRAAADLRLRPSGHWDRLVCQIWGENMAVYLILSIKITLQNSK